MSDMSRIADEHHILKLANAYSHAVTRRDGKMSAAVYAEDGELVAFGRPPIKGRAALEKAFHATFSPLAFITQSCFAPVIEVGGKARTGAVMRSSGSRCLPKPMSVAAVLLRAS